MPADGYTRVENPCYAARGAPPPPDRVSSPAPGRRAASRSSPEGDAMKLMTATIRTVPVAALACLACGCGLGHKGDPQALSAESFLAPRVIDSRNQEGSAVDGRASPTPIDRSGPLYDNVHRDLLETEQERRELEAGPDVTGISKTVQESVDSPRTAKLDRPEGEPKVPEKAPGGRFAV